MKCYFLLSCLMVIVVVVSSVLAGGGIIGSTCKDSRECSSLYCRAEKCTKFGDVPEEKGRKNPCIPNPCFLGEPCALQEVQCSRVYCLPIAKCWGDSFW